jgi:hypothetical protein
MKSQQKHYFTSLKIYTGVNKHPVHSGIVGTGEAADDSYQ